MLKKMFLRLDSDKNGTLNIDEIKKGMDEIEAQVTNRTLSVSYDKLLDKKSRIAEYMDLMKSLDKNGDGVVSYDEFIAAAVNKVALLNQQNIKSAF